MGEVTVPQALALGLEHHRAGRFREAESIYRRILSIQPQHPDALNLLGLLAVDAGHLPAAIELIRKAIAVRPDVGAYHSSLGRALSRGAQHDAAVIEFQRVVDLSPASAEALNDLAGALGAVGDLDQARRCIDRALTIRPDLAEAYNNLGSILHRGFQLQESIGAFRRAIELKPTFAEAHFNLAMVLLLVGDFEAGWKEHEWRLQNPAMQAVHRNFARPMWDGADLNGKVILLYSEQGLGDAIQFARYVPLIASRGGKVVLLCRRPLVTLFRSLDGVAQNITEGDALPKFDVHCPLLSLPMVFKTTLATVPTHSPSLKPDPAKLAYWRQRLTAIAGDRLKVGLVWAGNPEQLNDRNRSARLETFRPLMDIPGIAWFYMQKGAAADQASSATSGAMVHDLGPSLADFSDTAAAMANLDVMISVDTASAHLAGALGLQTWVMLAHLPDWRWLLQRDDSPWYPTMRLFRQTIAGNWDQPIQMIRELLINTRARA